MGFNIPTDEIFRYQDDYLWDDLKDHIKVMYMNQGIKLEGSIWSESDSDESLGSDAGSESSIEIEVESSNSEDKSDSEDEIESDHKTYRINRIVDILEQEQILLDIT